MNRKFITLALGTMVTLGAQAGVKVTSVDLKTSGANGYVNIALDGRSNELPDVRVYGKTIEITLTQADAFNGFSKTVSGAILSANVLNGKAIVKAVLPYNIDADGVNLGWKNKNIEVIFPRGKVEKAEPVEKKAESKVSKDQLNEDYLNKLMIESTAKAEAAKTETKKDEVSVKQAAIATQNIQEKTPAPIARPADNFSFAGYAAKFTVFLAMVLGLFYGVVQLLKKGVFSRGKLGFLNNSQMIQVLSTTYVAPKRSLMVVKAHNQIFLVSNSENGIQFLSEMTDTTGLIKEGEKAVTGTNFDLNLGSIQAQEQEPVFKIKENINESTPVPEEKGIQALTAKDIVKFSDELKKKAKKLKPIEFN